MSIIRSVYNAVKYLKEKVVKEGELVKGKANFVPELWY